MDQKIYATVKEIKEKYKIDGFLILGVFGSATKSDQFQADSDLDILYKYNSVLYERYPGLKFFELYEVIKKKLEEKPVGKWILPTENL